MKITNISASAGRSLDRLSGQARIALTITAEVNEGADEAWATKELQAFVAKMVEEHAQMMDDRTRADTERNVSAHRLDEDMPF